MKQFDVVDAGGFGRGSGFRFVGNPKPVGHRVGEPGSALENAFRKDIGLGGIEWIEADFDFVAGQMGRSLIETFLKQERGIAPDHAIQAVEEQTAHIGGGRQLADARDVALPALKWSGIGS